jgi:uncharacterized membrane protein YgcG
LPPPPHPPPPPLSSRLPPGPQRLLSFGSRGSASAALPPFSAAVATSAAEAGAPLAEFVEERRCVLNELLLERGKSPFMASLAVFVDGEPLTTVSADGLLIATQTGSTAYALSAGGSIVQPSSSSLVFVPICPHTLSFRPLVLSDQTELCIAVPADARSSAWASFDGRRSTELRRGDCVVVRASPWPLPLICRRSATADWVRAIREKLQWNSRAAVQKPLLRGARARAVEQGGSGGGGGGGGGGSGGGGGGGGGNYSEESEEEDE